MPCDGYIGRVESVANTAINTVIGYSRGKGMAGEVRGYSFIDAEDARNLLQVLVILIGRMSLLVCYFCEFNL